MSNSSGNDFQYYRYDPSISAAGVFAVLFFIFSLLHLYQLLRTKTWIFIPFVIGGFMEAIGYIGRILNANQGRGNWTLGPYIMQTLLLLVAPAFFAASIYMVLGRIILLTDGESHSLIRKKWLTKTFVIGDVFSFMTQSAGGGIMSSGGDGYKTGQKIVIGGLGIQVVVFGVFIVVAGLFHSRMKKVPTSKVVGGAIPWQKHMWALYVASIAIMVRSVFRLIEYIMGNDGYLLRHEVFLYVFDSILMLSVMVWLAWIHPSEIYAMLHVGEGVKAVKKGVIVYNMEFTEMRSPPTSQRGVANVV